MLQSIKFTKRQCNTVKIQHFWSWLVYEIVNLYYNVSEKQLPSYVLNNSMKNQPTLISFGKQHPKETRQWKVTNLPTSRFLETHNTSTSLSRT